MTSLYELTGVLAVMRRAMVEQAFDEQTISDTIEAESGDFDQKVIGCMMVCDELASDVDAIDAHIKRLTERKKRIEANREALKKRVLESMKVTKRHRVEHALGTVVFYPERDESIEILDADALPLSCLKIIPAKSEPIKAEVKKYLKQLSDDAAAKFGGARLVKNDRLEFKI